MFQIASASLFAYLNSVSMFCYMFCVCCVNVDAAQAWSSVYQTGQQLTCQLNPSADHIRKQLSQLKDQWQTLKQTADSQSRSVGGARNLQEFNKKVDKLEAWIKEKV